MNYWIVSTIALVAVLITVLVLDSKHINKLNSMADASDDETRAWMRRCEELRMDIQILEERDAKQIAHLVLIRDEEIEHLKRTISEMETKHRRELDLREKRIYTLEKKASDQQIAKEAKK
jgi:hypothetical protein